MLEEKRTRIRTEIQHALDDLEFNSTGYNSGQKSCRAYQSAKLLPLDIFGASVEIIFRRMSPMRGPKQSKKTRCTHSSSDRPAPGTREKDVGFDWTKPCESEGSIHAGNGTHAFGKGYCLNMGCCGGFEIKLQELEATRGLCLDSVKSGIFEAYGKCPHTHVSSAANGHNGLSFPLNRRDAIHLFYC